MVCWSKRDLQSVISTLTAEWILAIAIANCCASGTIRNGGHTYNVSQFLPKLHIPDNLFVSIHMRYALSFIEYATPDTNTMKSLGQENINRI